MTAGAGKGVQGVRQVALDACWSKLPSGVNIVSGSARPLRAAHVFATRRAVLAKHLAGLRKKLEESGFAWVSASSTSRCAQ